MVWCQCEANARRYLCPHMSSLGHRELTTAHYSPVIGLVVWNIGHSCVHDDDRQTRPKGLVCFGRWLESTRTGASGHKLGSRYWIGKLDTKHVRYINVNIDTKMSQEIHVVLKDGWTYHLFNILFRITRYKSTKLRIASCFCWESHLYFMDCHKRGQLYGKCAMCHIYRCFQYIK